MANPGPHRHRDGRQHEHLRPRNGAPLATDRGGGTVTATGGTYIANATDSPGIYSTGSITVSGATFTEKTSENIVIEGANSATVCQHTMASAPTVGRDDHTRACSGDATGSQGTVTLSGGSLANDEHERPGVLTSPIRPGVISLTNVTVTEAPASSSGRQPAAGATSGSNGGRARLTCRRRGAHGRRRGEQHQLVDLSLTNGSTLTGAINAGQGGEVTGLTLDGTSSWTVTANRTWAN